MSWEDETSGGNVPWPGTAPRSSRYGPVSDRISDPDVEPYHGQATQSFVGAIAPGSIDVDAEQRRIVVLLRRMPFSGLVHDPLPDPNKTDDLYLAWLYEWLLTYQRVIKAQSDDFTHQAQIMRQLKDERAAVRGFFGLSPDDLS